MSAVQMQTGSTYSVQPTDQQVGRLIDKLVKPISHHYGSPYVNGGGVSVGTIMLIVGICLWLLGTSPGTILAGKILVGIAIAPTICFITLVLCALTAKATTAPVVV
jgi:hypothetical protein